MYETSRSKPGQFGAPVVYNDTQIQVLDIVRNWKDGGYFYFEADTGCEFVLVKLAVTNLGSSEDGLRVHDDNFRIRGKGLSGYEFNCNGNPFTLGPARDPFDDLIEGGNVVTGNFITEVPLNTQELVLEFADDLNDPAVIFMSLDPDMSDPKVALPVTPAATNTPR